MSKLTLCFYNRNNPELVRTELLSADTRQLVVSIRGKQGVAGAGTFQWTSAVQALAVFLLRSRTSELQPYTLSGQRHSLASSLDFALSKEPTWLVEMFGVDLAGRARLRKMIRRTNSEQKFEGPVSLMLNPNYLSPAKITVFLDGEELSAPSKIAQLAQAIESQWMSRHLRLGGHKPPLLTSLKDPSMPGSFRYLLSHMIHRETSEMLRQSDVFSPSALKRRVRRISEHPSFVRLWPKGLLLQDSAGLFGGRNKPLALDVRARIDASFCQGSPLRIAVPSTLPASIAIFQYLKYERGYQIEIEYTYSHAIELVKKILNDSFVVPPDVCVLGIAPAGTLLASKRSSEYSPVMLMPMMSHRVVTPKQSAPRQGSFAGRYLFIRDDPSTALFYFEDLLRSGLIPKAKIATEHQEPDQVFSDLQNGDGSERAVLFFPHYDLNCAFNSCTFLDRPSGDANYKESILFCHDALARDSTRVNDLRLGINDAWLHLLQNRASLERAVNRLADDDRYAHFISRSSGMAQLPVPA